MRFCMFSCFFAYFHAFLHGLFKGWKTVINNNNMNSNMNPLQCSYCTRIFAQPQNLKKHRPRCKQRPSELEEERRLFQLRLESEREAHRIELQKQREMYERQIEQLEKRIEKWEKEVLEMAKRPTTTTTHQNQRTVQIVNQLGSYEFDMAEIEKLLEENFTTEVFQGGPEKIAELTAQVLLTDPATQKPKVVCTDVSRRMYRYLDPDTRKLQTDPGFQRTHKLIRTPLRQANQRVYCDTFLQDDAEDVFRDRWRENDEFIVDENKFPDKLQVFLKP